MNLFACCKLCTFLRCRCPLSLPFLFLCSETALRVLLLPTCASPERSLDCCVLFFSRLFPLYETFLLLSFFRQQLFCCCFFRAPHVASAVSRGSCLSPPLSQFRVLFRRLPRSRRPAPSQKLKPPPKPGLWKEKADVATSDLFREKTSAVDVSSHQGNLRGKGGKKHNLTLLPLSQKQKQHERRIRPLGGFTWKKERFLQRERHCS